MDCRHEFPFLCFHLAWDWSNPLLYWFLGSVGAILAALVLVLV